MADATTGFSTSNYLTRSAAVWPGAEPFMVSAWVHTPATTGWREVYSLGQSGSGDQRRALVVQFFSSALHATAFSRTTTGATADSSGVSGGAWEHIMAGFVSASLREAYHSGGNRVQNTATRSVGAPNITRVGIAPDGTVPFFDGLAEVSVWDVTGFSQTDRESLVSKLATLVDGFAPTATAVNAETGQPWAGTLVAYWPLDQDAASPFNDQSGNAHHGDAVEPPRMVMERGRHYRLLHRRKGWLVVKFIEERPGSDSVDPVMWLVEVLGYDSLPSQLACARDREGRKIVAPRPLLVRPSLVTEAKILPENYTHVPQEVVRQIDVTPE